MAASSRQSCCFIREIITTSSAHCFVFVTFLGVHDIHEFDKVRGHPVLKIICLLQIG